MARQVDGVGDQRRRGIGRGGVAASTVTASAMPSEKLRPRQPLVAMPRTGSAARITRRSAKPWPVPAIAARDRGPARKMDGDVAAVVDIGLVELGGRQSSPP